MSGAGGARARAAWAGALVSLFFLAYTILATWPQVLHLSDGMADLWDAKLSAWILHWDYWQTLRDPLNLFQAPILHPARYVLAFSENFYGAAVFGFPLLAAGASIVVNYNVLLLGGMWLSAMSAWALARYVTGDAVASLVAGLVYAFLPYKLSQLAHFHMEWGPFLCLTFLFLLRYLDGGRRRDAVLLCGCFAWNTITGIQYAFFTSFLVAVVLALEACNGGPARSRRIGGALLAVAAAVVICLPFFVPYKKASDLYQMRRTIGEMTFFSAKPGYLLSAGERNKLYGPITARFRGPEGDFFPGLLPLGLAGLALARLRRRGLSAASPLPVSPRRRRGAHALDALVILLAALWIASRASPGLRIGPLRVGDSGRVLVFATLAIVARLAVAFPRRSRFRDLGDWLRRQALDRRALLLVVVALTGVVVALGGHTPYYRFLFQSFGTVFRAIRVSGRAIVLFQAALAVLAAWGFSLWTRGRSRRARAAWIGGAVLLLTIEYRAFPIRIFPYDAAPVPVYEWLKHAAVEGGVVEWPLGFPHDCEYTLRQAEHEKPLVNGHSSFAPRPYERLYALLHQRPIPESVWDAMAGLDAALLVFHAHEGEPMERSQYRRLLRQGMTDGRLELLAAFPRTDGPDFVLRLTSSNKRVAVPAGSAAAKAELERYLAVPEADISPPFGMIHVPAKGQRVAAGSWGFGWALDDSGIAEIRIGTELGPDGIAMLGSVWPSLKDAFPDFTDAEHGGYGFVVPNVPPGPHTLRVTLIARDGGRTVLECPINVGARQTSSTPKGSGT